MALVPGWMIRYRKRIYVYPKRLRLYNNVNPALKLLYIDPTYPTSESLTRSVENQG